jgi:hypothetical protein
VNPMQVLHALLGEPEARSFVNLDGLDVRYQLLKFFLGDFMFRSFFVEAQK